MMKLVSSIACHPLALVSFGNSENVYGVFMEMYQTVTRESEHQQNKQLPKNDKKGGGGGI